jgi:hypothetical protein
MRRSAALPLFAALALAACSEFPEQGFATHAMGGPPGALLHDTFAPSTDFRGERLDTPQQAATRPASPAHGDVCKRTAQQRAVDAHMQGFDKTVKQQVYAQTLSDCEAWSQLHMVH